MRRYPTSEMRNVIKYRRNVVLCLVVALVFAKKSAEKRTDCIYIDLALPMDFTVVSFTLAVNNRGCGWLNLKIIPTICQFL